MFSSFSFSFFLFLWYVSWVQVSLSHDNTLINMWLYQSTNANLFRGQVINKWVLINKSSVVYQIMWCKILIGVVIPLVLVILYNLYHALLESIQKDTTIKRIQLCENYRKEGEDGQEHITMEIAIECDYILMVRINQWNFESFPTLVINSRRILLLGFSKTRFFIPLNF